MVFENPSQKLYKKRVSAELEDIKKLKNGNGKLLLDYYKSYCIDLSPARASKVLGTLKQICRRVNKPIDALTIKDVENLFYELAKEGTKSENTINDFKKILKTYLRWLDEVEFEKLIKSKKLTCRKVKNNLQARDLLTVEERIALINACEKPGHRALISVLVESGCRVGELIGLCIKDVELDEQGARLHVNGKTGQRTVRLVVSVPVLRDWVNQTHPLRRDKSAPLFVSENGKAQAVNYGSLSALLKRLAKRAGIEGKRINPHSFRHCVASELLAKLPQSLCCDYLGWSKDSKMAGTYAHFSEQANDAVAALRSNGEVKMQPKQELQLRNCFKCGKPHSPHVEYCEDCNILLDARQVVLRDDKARTRDKEEMKKMINELIDLKLAAQQGKG